MQFSIIVPVYNVEKYLPECVESILKQKFKDFELILVDDGSQDKSAEICDYYASKDTRIVVFHKKNEGQAIARNVGIDFARGNYVVFIDSDDYIIDDNFLQKVYDKSKNNTDIICYKFSKFFDKNKVLEKCKFDTPVFLTNDTYGKKILKLVSNDAFYCSPWSKAIKTSILKKSKFIPGLLSEDQDWYYRVVLNSKSIESINETFIAYRQRENSTSISWKIKNLTDTIYIILKWQSLFLEEDIDEELRYALYNSLSKLYCNLLVGYTKFDNSEKKYYKPTLKKMSKLMKYNENPRVKKFSIVYMVGGIDLILLILRLICKRN